jgi:Thoeris protein ThsB, TIR-like domain
MPRRVFYSIHYKPDSWRVSQIKQMGAIEGQRILHANEWEQIERQPDGIKRWINEAMQGKSCVVVVIGSQTYTSPWVDYEIRKGWDEGKGVLGVYVHGLKDVTGYTCAKGPCPFTSIGLKNGKCLSDYVPMFDPIGIDSKAVYAAIEANLPAWIDYAIKVREDLKRAA